jgi:SOS-response transcriptional repressor LexA
MEILATRYPNKIFWMAQSPGDRLRQLREDRGLGVREVARLSEGAFTHAYVSNLENGQSAWPKASLTTIRGFARAFNMSVDKLLSFVAGDEQPDEKELAIQALERLEVHPDWVAFPVYGAVSAGKNNPDPIDGEVAYFPLEKIIKKGARARDIRVYLVNGDCMISPEAARVEKNIAPYDYIAVDTGSKPRPGDVVVAWWPREDKMVVKRYQVEYEGIVLSPTNPAHPNLVLGHEDDLMILGRVVMRTG